MTTDDLIDCLWNSVAKITRFALILDLDQYQITIDDLNLLANSPNGLQHSIGKLCRDVNTDTHLDIEALTHSERKIAQLFRDAKEHYQCPPNSKLRLHEFKIDLRHRIVTLNLSIVL